MQNTVITDYVQFVSLKKLNESYSVLQFKLLDTALDVASDTIDIPVLNSNIHLHPHTSGVDTLAHDANFSINNTVYTGYGYLA